MIRISRTSVRIAVLLMGAAIVLAPTAVAETWQQNISMLVQTDGKPDGLASVYDSPDYQQLLLHFDGKPSAFVLNLGDGTVYGCPGDSIRTDQEGNALLGLFKMDFVSDLERKDAVLSFTTGGHSIAVQPIPPLIGPAPLQRILEIKPAYAHAAQTYKADPTKIAAIKSVSTDTEIRVYFGTWCLLCKRVVPYVMRSIELAANPRIKVTYVGVDEDVKEPAADIAKDHITKTPTIIVLQGGIEVGRIEEKVETTVEGDLAQVLSTKR